MVMYLLLCDVWPCFDCTWYNAKWRVTWWLMMAKSWSYDAHRGIIVKAPIIFAPNPYHCCLFQPIGLLGKCQETTGFWQRKHFPVTQSYEHCPAELPNCQLWSPTTFKMLVNYDTVVAKHHSPTMDLAIWSRWHRSCALALTLESVTEPCLLQSACTVNTQMLHVWYLYLHLDHGSR